MTLGLDAEIVTGVAPNVLFTFPIAIELSRVTPSILSPAARLRFSISATSTGTAGVGADFVWGVGSLDLCPLAWSPRVFRLQACARLEIGAEAVSGKGVMPVRSSLRPFVGVGPIVDLRWSIGRVFLDAEGGAIVALLQDHYFIEPNVEIFRVPVIGARAGLGFGVFIF
jgi:hypothetical protein